MTLGSHAAEMHRHLGFVFRARREALRRWGGLTVAEARAWARHYVERELARSPEVSVLAWRGSRGGSDEPGCDAGCGIIVIGGRFPLGVGRLRRYPHDLLGHRFALVDLIAEINRTHVQLELFGGGS